MPDIDASWQAWIAENVSRGCTTDSMVSSMVQAGFHEAAARSYILLYTSTGTMPATTIVAPAIQAVGNYQYEAPPLPKGHRIDVGDRVVEVIARGERPYAAVFANVLSYEECDEIIERSRSKLKRSTTVNAETGAFDIIEKRTSEGTFFEICEDEFIARIDHRVAKLMNWPVENGEGLQILRYGVGGEYTPHFDYFAPNEPGSASHLAVGGQRVATMIIYLSDCEAGGETIFPDVGFSVVPRKGCAVYFHYCNSRGQLDALSLHGGAPVIAGEKWIMTKWMRQRRYG